MTARPGWHTALGFALTGEWLELPPAELPDPETLLAQLADAGWSGERLAEAARQSHQVPADVVATLGAAQFWAVLVDLRRRVGATGEVRPPAMTRPLTADERRLAADRPPHW
ncbi:hypothetical protein AADG42_05665 [Ammonicoccus fulvus]|uniref:Uncharacterized protein n=1 Tax=Ammonicoccus fulvus TaxID=3138240 RepID=A0ABZ3FLA4_9ACTN